jgi:D-alanyl-D-alanine dipeptidase
MSASKLKHEFSRQDYTVVEFNNQNHPRIQVCPRYFELGFSPVPQIWGRYAVLARLLRTLNFLPLEYGLLIWDVYRSRAVQAKLFAWMRDEIRNKFPQLTEQENYQETLKYVALPCKVGDSYCSPHLSGGAIDLTLLELKSGKELDMGTPFDDCTERAHKDYFNLQNELTSAEKEIKERRNLLSLAMNKAGFTSYHYEWWHFDLGNLPWGRVLSKAAVFGPLFGDDEWPS